MCCIAVQPVGDAPIDQATLANMWQGNHDGAGFMFAHAGKLVVRKPFFKLADLSAAYAADHAEYGRVSSFVLHFRYSTHGLKDGINTHPHILAGGRAALVHNGILHDFAPHRGAAISDTVRFCAQVLAYRQASQLTSARFARHLGAMIGDSNKLAIMDFSGKVQIVNEDRGVWDGGRWYSNTCFQPATAPAWFGMDRLPAKYRQPAWTAQLEDEDRPWWNGSSAAADDEPDTYSDQLYDDMYDETWHYYCEMLAGEAVAAGGTIDWTKVENQATYLTELDMDDMQLAEGQSCASNG